MVVPDGIRSMRLSIDAHNAMSFLRFSMISICSNNSTLMNGKNFLKIELVGMNGLIAVLYGVERNGFDPISIMRMLCPLWKGVPIFFGPSAWVVNLD